MMAAGDAVKRDRCEMLTVVSVVVRRVLATLFLMLICAVLIATSRRAADAPTTSDTAVIESYTLMASSGTLLVGAYSRFQWHHPGPLYFYLLAPFYVASGDRTAGLNAGAAGLSIMWIALITAMLLRRRPSLALFTSGFLALYAWRAAEATASPWNPHVPLLPMAALIVAAADVLAGNPASLPLVALLASLAGQAHIAVLPSALAVGAVASVRAAAGAARSKDRGRWLRAVGWTAVVLAASWALPLYEQVTAKPRGNFTELWQFFASRAGGRQPLGLAVSAWSDMLVGVVRPDFYVAHGWPFAESPVHWAEWLTLASLAAAGLYVVTAIRRRESFTASLGGLILLTAGIALWSTTRIEERVFDHDVFWMAGIGVLALSAAADFVISTLRRSVNGGAPAAARIAAIALAVCAAVAAALQVDDVARRSFNPPADALTARALADDLDKFMVQDGVARPLIKIDQDAWGYVAGAILDLQKRGRQVAVEEDWVVMFTPEFRASGREDATITVAMPAEHLRLTERGVRLISSHEPVYAHAEQQVR